VDIVPLLPSLEHCYALRFWPAPREVWFIFAKKSDFVLIITTSTKTPEVQLPYEMNDAGGLFQLLWGSCLTSYLKTSKKDKTFIKEPSPLFIFLSQQEGKGRPKEAPGMLLGALRVEWRRSIKKWGWGEPYLLCKWISTMGINWSNVKTPSCYINFFENTELLELHSRSEVSAFCIFNPGGLTF